jgi:dihydroxyacetone kinase
MTKIINDKESLVCDAIDGYLRTSDLVRLDGYPHIKVVMRTELDSKKVMLISGGGSGHEPAHAGFVGQGMLAAAVCGEVFASPSVDAVFAAIMAVTGDAGCLLIVKNYTGDRLNFGLAAERAKALGKQVEMVVVADDVALPNIAQPRGVAGTLFVHKVAGHLAEQGEPLDIVAATARKVALAARSFGAALDTCTIPGSEKESRIAPGEAEMGLGIHGEPGVETVTFESASGLCTAIMDALFTGQSTEHSFVLLLNNLGSTTPLEMQSLANIILSGAHAHRISGVLGPAPLMTSLDMHGFSVSILPAEQAFVEALSSLCEPSAWPVMQSHAPVVIQPLPNAMSRPAHAPSANAAIRKLIVGSCAAFVSMEKDLNALDAKTGDGDTGSTLAQAARSLDEAVDSLPLADPTGLLRAISDQLSVSMGGSSGVLLAILFSAAGDASANGSQSVAALRAGLGKMMEYGGAEPGHRTMVDALMPALDALVSGASLAEAAKAARIGADSTATMTRARSGRSAYVPESALVGVTDPGAEGVARFFSALADNA